MPPIGACRQPLPGEVIMPRAGGQEGVNHLSLPERQERPVFQGAQVY
jgi:hypothetical protein